MTPPSAQPLSAGQKKAIESIRAIAKLSRGALTLDAFYAQSVYGLANVRVWLSSASLPHSEHGLRLRPWEPIDIAIPEDFPESPPIAAAGHNDFNSLPHVVRGSGFCVRISPNNWYPSFGMTGFLQEVITTYRHISLGSLDGHLLPWHPPPADPSVVCVVVKADLPRPRQAASKPLLRWAAAVTSSPERVDIIGWLDFPKDVRQDKDQAADELSSALNSLQDIEEQWFLVPALILPRPTAFEYTYSLEELLELSADMEIADRFLEAIGVINQLNKKLCQQESPEDFPPTILLLRAPADTSFSSSDPDAHFAAAVLAPDDAQFAESLLADDGDQEALRQMADDLLGAPVFWAEVYDSRPEVLLRRGNGRPTGKLAGARVVVLGCGALGAQIAEHCVRAGVARLHLVDSAEINPGILVRQPFEDADIGQPKAEILARRLGRIRPGTPVSASVTDILSLDLPGGKELGPPDLIIDATANRAVATKIERTRRHAQDTWPTLVTVGISQAATAGIAAVTPPGFAGAGVDLLRRLGLETSQDEELTDIHDEFFPPPAQRILFHPEPGCSDATFIGSATDVYCLAAQLLDSALTRLDSVITRTPGPSVSGPARASLCIARLGRDESRKPARVVLDVHPDQLLEDQSKGYQVRLDQRVARNMLQIVTEAAARQDTPDGHHTGGLLLGQFDDACQVAWVSEATRPPRGSTTSKLGLELNIPEAQKYLEARREQSGGLISHIGFWHLHEGSPEPSETDRRAMQGLLGYAPRMLLLVLGIPGLPPSGPDLDLSSAVPDMYAEVFTA